MTIFFASLLSPALRKLIFPVPAVSLLAAVADTFHAQVEVAVYEFSLYTASVRVSRQRYLNMVTCSYVSAVCRTPRTNMWGVNACIIARYLPLTHTEGPPRCASHF